MIKVVVVSILNIKDNFDVFILLIIYCNVMVSIINIIEIYVECLVMMVICMLFLICLVSMFKWFRVDIFCENVVICLSYSW